MLIPDLLAPAFDQPIMIAEMPSKMNSDIIIAAISSGWN
jgi:hypothetical protein